MQPLSYPPPHSACTLLHSMQPPFIPPPHSEWTLLHPMQPPFLPPPFCVYPAPSYATPFYIPPPFCVYSAPYFTTPPMPTPTLHVPRSILAWAEVVPEPPRMERGTRKVGGGMGGGRKEFSFSVCTPVRYRNGFSHNGQPIERQRTLSHE